MQITFDSNDLSNLDQAVLKTLLGLTFPRVADSVLPNTAECSGTCKDAVPAEAAVDATRDVAPVEAVQESAREERDRELAEAPASRERMMALAEALGAAKEGQAVRSALSGIKRRKLSAVPDDEIALILPLLEAAARDAGISEIEGADDPVAEDTVAGEVVFTKVEVLARARKFINDGMRPRLLAVLEDFGVEKVSDLGADQYSAFMTSLDDQDI